MISSERFCIGLIDQGCQFVVGVPCGHLSGAIAWLDDAGLYLPAANEGAAVAIAAGAHMMDRNAAVMVQNSGLGNLINPLTSLLIPFQIPVLFVATLRGWPNPDNDEPQHATMGRATQAILESCGVPHWTISPNEQDYLRVLSSAMEVLKDGLPAFILVPRNTIDRTPRTIQPAQRWTRRDVIASLLAGIDDAAIVSTTGFTSRELFELDDRPGTFYMQGSMGHAMALGLGVAMADPDRFVVVIDGDGAAVMHLGTMTTIGHVAPSRLLHVVIDNGSYESTGAQRTSAHQVDWPTLAHAVGYRYSRVVTSEQEVEEALMDMRTTPGPYFLVAHVDLNDKDAPPRATRTHAPTALRARFEGNLKRNCKEEES
jgi:phosphonopyruvate decarboxylase